MDIQNVLDFITWRSDYWDDEDYIEWRAEEVGGVVYIFADKMDPDMVQDKHYEFKVTVEKI